MRTVWGGNHRWEDHPWVSARHRVGDHRCCGGAVCVCQRDR